MNVRRFVEGSSPTSESDEREQARAEMIRDVRVSVDTGKCLDNLLRMIHMSLR